jgi:general secretion pathway protein C
MTKKADSSIPASTDPLAAVASAATLVAIVALGCVLAYWTWVWVAPRPGPRVPTIEIPRSGAGASALFGAVQRDSRIAAPTGAAMKLLGVAAGSRQMRGYAVLQVGGKDIVAIREGADIVAGIRLAEVHRDRIVLERNGLRETLEWPQSSVAGAPAPAKQSLAAAPASSTASPPGGPAQSPAVPGPPPSKADRDRLSD